MSTDSFNKSHEKPGGNSYLSGNALGVHPRNHAIRIDLSELWLRDKRLDYMFVLARSAVCNEGYLKTELCIMHVLPDRVDCKVPGLCGAS